MSAKHTPGPWTVGRGRTKTTQNSNMLLCSNPACIPLAYFPASGQLHGVDAANARLIAAAPELLEALKLARSALSKASDVETFRAVSAAIAKAEGQS